MSRIRFHELICEFGNLRKSSFEFARLRFGSFLGNQCYVANSLYCMIYTKYGAVSIMLLLYPGGD